MRERMSAVDTAGADGFRQELMMIVGGLRVRRQARSLRLSDLLKERLVTHLRFRSRVVRDATGCYGRKLPILIVTTI